MLKPFFPSKMMIHLSFFVISGAFLFCAFYANYFDVVSHRWFKYHQKDTEAHIIGRLLQSKKEGIFSYGGLTGYGSHQEKKGWIGGHLSRENYRFYKEEKEFKYFKPYLSQIGGQGILFGFLDHYYLASPVVKLRTYYLLTAGLSAIALALIALWVKLEFGWSNAIFVLLVMVGSQWLTVFGKNLWWSLWAFYVPMILYQFYFRIKNASVSLSYPVIFVIGFIGVFIKCFINGYEYITACFLMMLVPLVYFFILHKTPCRSFFLGLMSSALGAMLAVLISLLVLFFQIAEVKGSLSDGYDHAVFSIAKRTHGNQNKLPKAYAKSLKAGTWAVVNKYLDGDYFNADKAEMRRRDWYEKGSFSISYRSLVYIVFIGLFCSALLFFLFYYHLDKKKYALKLLALNMATLFSFMAPLSWLFIFKAHSYIHTHMNFILWQMPFVFFGAAFIVHLIKSFGFLMYCYGSRIYGKGKNIDGFGV